MLARAVMHALHVGESRRRATPSYCDTYTKAPCLKNPSRNSQETDHENHVGLCGRVLDMGALVVGSAPSWAQAPGPLNAITDVPGIEVGQYTQSVATGGMTGTTVIVARGGATGGVSQRGGAPGTGLAEAVC